MLKHLILNSKCNNLIKNQAANHVHYRLVKTIGIIYNASQFSRESIELLIDRIQGDGKDCTAIAFVEGETVDALAFNKKDISLSGNIDKHELKSFLNQSFDFLISLDTSGDINYKYALAKSRASCKVGIDNENYSELYMLSIRPLDNGNESVEDLLSYLRKI